MSTSRIPISLLALLGVCSTLAPMAMNMHVPAMALLAESLSVDRATASLTVTVYLWFFGGSMLFVGAPTDRFGRRRTLIAGLFVFLSGALLAAFAQSFPVILAGRVIAAFGAAAVLVVPRTMINDLVSGPLAVRYLGSLGVIMAAAPALAPILGEVLNHIWSWPAIFAFQAAIAVVGIIWCLVALPETRAAEADIAASGSALHSVHAGRPVREVVGPVFVMATTTAVYFAFLASGADALLVHFEGESWMLAGLLGALASVYVIGNMLVARLSTRFTPLKLLRAGALLLTLSLPLTIASSYISYLAVCASMCVYALGNGLITPTALAVAGGVEGRYRAKVMAVASSTPYLLGGIFASLTVVLNVTTWTRFEVLMVVCGLVTLVAAFTSSEPQGAKGEA